MEIGVILEIIPAMWQPKTSTQAPKKLFWHIFVSVPFYLWLLSLYNDFA